MTLSGLVRRAERLADRGARALLGVTGPPGAGKSTLAAVLTEALGHRAVCVPMDGFHLAQRELERLGRADRKGAPDTFDTAGYIALLRRLREAEGSVVYAPSFDRDLEEPIAGAIAVPPSVPLVITEGNYLLLDDGEWSHVRDLLDEVWYVDLDPRVRVERLIARHVRHGRSVDEARAWVMRSDEANAARVAPTADAATVVVHLD